MSAAVQLACPTITSFPRVPRKTKWGTVLPADQINTDPWQPAWKKNHSAAEHRVSSPATAQDRVAAMLQTKEWKGSSVEYRSHYFSKSAVPEAAIRIKHPSGAVCFLRAT